MTTSQKVISHQKSGKISSNARQERNMDSEDPSEIQSLQNDLNTKVDSQTDQNLNSPDVNSSKKSMKETQTKYPDLKGLSKEHSDQNIHQINIADEINFKSMLSQISERPEGGPEESEGQKTNKNKVIDETVEQRKTSEKQVKKEKSLEQGDQKIKKQVSSKKQMIPQIDQSLEIAQDSVLQQDSLLINEMKSISLLDSSISKNGDSFEGAIPDPSYDGLIGQMVPPGQQMYPEFILDDSISKRVEQEKLEKIWHESHNLKQNLSKNKGRCPVCTLKPPCRHSKEFSNQTSKIQIRSSQDEDMTHDLENSAGIIKNNSLGLDINNSSIDDEVLFQEDSNEQNQDNQFRKVMNFKEKLGSMMPENSALSHFYNQAGSSTDRASPNRLLKSTISSIKPAKQTSQYIKNFYNAKFTERMGGDYHASQTQTFATLQYSGRGSRCQKISDVDNKVQHYAKMDYICGPLTNSHSALSSSPHNQKKNSTELIKVSPYSILRQSDEQTVQQAIEKMQNLAISANYGGGRINRSEVLRQLALKNKIAKNPIIGKKLRISRDQALELGQNPLFNDSQSNPMQKFRYRNQRGQYQSVDLGSGQVLIDRSVNDTASILADTSIQSKEARLGKDINRAEHRLRTIEMISHYREEKIRNEFMKLQEELFQENERLEAERVKQERMQEYFKAKKEQLNSFQQKKQQRMLQTFMEKEQRMLEEREQDQLRRLYNEEQKEKLRTYKQIKMEEIIFNQQQQQIMLEQSMRLMQNRPKRDLIKLGRFQPNSPFNYKPIPMDFKNFNKVRFEAHEFNVNERPEDENSFDNTNTINQTERVTSDNTQKPDNILPSSQPISSEDNAVKDQYPQNSQQTEEENNVIELLRDQGQFIQKRKQKRSQKRNQQIIYKSVEKPIILYTNKVFNIVNSDQKKEKRLIVGKRHLKQMDFQQRLFDQKLGQNEPIFFSSENNPLSPQDNQDVLPAVKEQGIRFEDNQQQF